MSECLCQLKDIHDQEVVKAGLRCMIAFYRDYIGTEEIEHRKEAAQKRIEDAERVLNDYS